MMSLQKLKKVLVITAACLGLIVGGFVTQTFLLPPDVEAQKSAIDTHATGDSVATLAHAINNFSLALYNHLCRGSTENVFFSPYSIFVALAMTYEGARGTTAQDMYEVLGFQQNNDTALCSFGKIYNHLNIDAEYTLHTANALWTQDQYPFLPDYLYFIENYYMGRATSVDFTDAEKAANLISHWVEDHTGGNIKDFLTADDIHPLTRLILTNAIYFKGNWDYQFPVKNTVTRAFEVSPNLTVDIPMMKCSAIPVQYAETEQVQMVELPYESDRLSMLIVLPKENDSSTIDDMVTPDKLTEWRSALTETNIDVSLPKFTLDTEYLVNQALMDMGITVPFTCDADFSGMDGSQDLYIEKVMHKAFIEVTEKGTEAAGATSVHMTLTAMPDSVVFNADHPFTFIIQHQATGTILFMGKVSNPQ